MPITRGGNPSLLVTTTKAAQLIPAPQTPLRKKGLFKPVAAASRLIEVQELNGVLSLIPDKPLGAEATLNESDERDFRYFHTLHYPLSGRVRGSDVQGRTDFLTGQKADTLKAALDREIASQKRKHVITNEYHQMGALQGIIRDPFGNIRLNLYERFEVTQKMMNFELSDSSFNVLEACYELRDWMKSNLFEDMMTGVCVECSIEFINSLIKHPMVAKVYEGHAAAVARNEEDVREIVKFGGVLFEEYNMMNSGNIAPFIQAGEAHAYPTGTTNLFEIYYAPAELNSIQLANTTGVEMYALRTLEAKGRWIEVDTESNPLAICKQPKCLVKLTKS